MTSTRSSRRSSVVVGTKTCVVRQVRHRVRRKRRRSRPAGPRSSRSRANPQGTEHAVNTRRAPQEPIEEPRLDLHGSISDRQHAQILASTVRHPPRTASPAGRANSCCGSSSTSHLFRKLGNALVITMSVVSGRFVYRTSGAQRAPAGGSTLAAPPPECQLAGARTSCALGQRPCRTPGTAPLPRRHALGGRPPPPHVTADLYEERPGVAE